MELFHGSDIEVRKPQLLATNRTLDFGRGFYTTTSRQQAVDFTKNVNRRNGSTDGIVSVYELDDEKAVSLNILKFAAADETWLDFVMKNRLKKIIEPKFDIVIGAVANDNVFTTLILYADGTITKQETLARLKTKRLFDQYAFQSEKALSFLEYKHSFKVEGVNTNDK
ncbi:hypothetical protein FACS1894190_10020 [Spirochaetia bacterium]|nr:hypothetical protein FACS1894190_10020 [Spirochaetia bacterium]